MGIQRKSAVAIGVATLFGVGAVGGMALAHGDSTRLRADLGGTNEVPVADPDGDGRAKVEIYVDDGTVCFSVRFDDTGTPNRGHIHVGVAGVNGGIVVPSSSSGPHRSGRTGRPGERRIGVPARLEDCVAADPALLAADRGQPGRLLRQPAQRPLPRRRDQRSVGRLSRSPERVGLGSPDRRAGPARPASARPRAARAARPGCVAGAPTTPAPRASPRARTVRRRAPGRRRARRSWRGSGRRRRARRHPTTSRAAVRRTGRGRPRAAPARPSP